jgi:hypothetical protein
MTDITVKIMDEVLKISAIGTKEVRRDRAGVLHHRNNSQEAYNNIAAEHWVAHAKVENVASRIPGGMQYHFDFDELWSRWPILLVPPPKIKRQPEASPLV